MHCNVPIVENKTMIDCTAYHMGKEHKLTFSASKVVYIAPLQMVAVDV